MIPTISPQITAGASINPFATPTHVPYPPASTSVALSTFSASVGDGELLALVFIAGTVALIALALACGWWRARRNAVRDAA